jgi:AcrR family transcriptional regulator
MSSEKQEKILGAAWPVFLKYGYKRVTMGDIADAAGISRPALYLIFNKKEDVFTAVVRHNSNHRLEEIREALARSGKSAKEKLKFAFEVWTVRPFDTIMGSEEAKELLDCGFGFARDTMEQSYASFQALITPILQPLLKGSAIKNLSAKQIAHILTSSVRGFKLVSKNSAELRAMIDDLLNMTLAALGSN